MHAKNAAIRYSKDFTMTSAYPG